MCLILYRFPKSRKLTSRKSIESESVNWFLELTIGLLNSIKLIKLKIQAVLFFLKMNFNYLKVFIIKILVKIFPISIKKQKNILYNTHNVFGRCPLPFHNVPVIITVMVLESSFHCRFRIVFGQRNGRRVMLIREQLPFQ